MLIVPRRVALLPDVIRLRQGRPRVRVTGTVAIKDDSVELVGGEQYEPFEGKPYIEAEEIAVEP